MTTTVPPSDATCPQCGRDIPRLEFCVRCGFPIEGETVPARRSQRSRYAAAPNENVRSVHVLSTLFPQLPRAEMGFFGVALALGAATLVVLALFGLYPLALTAAAVLVPLVLLLYLYAIDVYEDEPVLVVGLTMAWGALAGTAIGIGLQNIGSPLGPPGLHLLGESDVLVRVIAVPLLGAVLVLVGPLVLLRHPRFNDVLDGTTFGAATAVALVGAQTLVQAWPLVSGGSRPLGAATPWLVSLAEIGLLVPVIWAGALGLVCAALWLRFRAPVRDRGALGPLGSPAVALVIAAVLVVAAPVGLEVLDRTLGLLWVTALSLVALTVLRRAIHLGLVEEADEIEIGPEVTCANCHRATPRHTFCGRCGVALRALPKHAAGRRSPESSATGARP